MRSVVCAGIATVVLSGICPPGAKSQDIPTAVDRVRRPAPPEVADPPKEAMPVGGGSSNSIVANEGEKMASFFFGDGPPDLHYTYYYEVNEVEHYYLTRETLRLIGSDKTGNYWHYRTLLADIPSNVMRVPKDWYVPKDPFKHPAVWFQTQEPNAQIQYYGKTAQYMSVRRRTKEPSRK